MPNKLDKIVIIGAGPAGCSCAIWLLNTGKYEVVIIDNAKDGKFSIGESIPPDMNLLLRQLGIYESFLKQEHEACYGSCSYWGSPKRGYNDSMLSPHGHGWHLDRAAFNLFLVEECRKRGAQIMNNTTYLGSKALSKGYQLAFQQKGKTTSFINADFVVDATGSKGVFAKEQGSLKQQGTSLVCLGLRFKNKALKEVSKLTHLESVEHGWWYAARIPGNYILVTFYTTAPLVKELGLHDLSNFIGLLAASPNTFNLLAQMEPADSKIKGFNAQSFCLDKVSGKDWLAIGDAATTYDPITSQGITKATIQGARAAELIAPYLDGTKEAMVQYQKEVKDQFEYYLSSRNYFYNLEQRWPQSPFWKALHSTTAAEVA